MSFYRGETQKEQFCPTAQESQDWYLKTYFKEVEREEFYAKMDSYSDKNIDIIRCMFQAKGCYDAEWRFRYGGKVFGFDLSGPSKQTRYFLHNDVLS